MSTRCTYQKRNGEQCRNFALHGRIFCNYHTPNMQLWQWIKRKKEFLISIIIAIIIGIGVPIYYNSKDLLKLPFEKLKGERIKYYDGEKDSKLIEKIISSGIEVKDIIKIGVREGIDYFIIYFDPEDTGLGFKMLIYRNRTEANMEPLEVRIPYQVSNARYENIFRDYESAIVVWDSQGSGNFLTIHVLMWTMGEYTDLAKKVEPDLPDATFAFADLDIDGRKELIIAHGRKAIIRATQYFKLSKKHFLYEKVDPNDPLYNKFKESVWDIKDKVIFEEEVW